MAVKVNRGDERLLTKSEWVDESAIHGNDELVLNAPVMVKAQERILEQFTPTNSIALVSLCTSTRPYSKSPKWKTFLGVFSGVDFIVSSNGGVVPLEYEGSYPYMTYDAHGQKQFDELYIVYTIRNLIRFFISKRYDFIVFNFRPTLRNKKAGLLAGRYLKRHNHINDYAVLPSLGVYEAAEFQTMRSKLFPDIHPAVLDEIKRQIEVYRA